MERPRPLALFILDGYGISEKEEGNAVRAAATPHLDQLFEKYPNNILQASGEAVGLPEGQMGNSEVGHLNLGAGRIVYQDYTRINKAVKEKTLRENQVLKNAVNHVQKHDRALHLMGLLSDGGVHSHIKHLFGLLAMADKANLDRVYVHTILDGRDTPPRSAIKYVEQLEEKLEELGTGEIATVSGRYYSMDRDNRWDRTKKAYDALVLGQGVEAGSAVGAVENSYEKDKNDEFVLPTVIKKKGKPVATVKDNDAFIFFNFRADRARQITRALGLDGFDKFQRPEEHPRDLFYVCMTEYDESFDLPIAFPPATIDKLFAEVLSSNNLRQLRIAETEKYAHVTFFFNGGEEQKFEGEDRKLIPSPRIDTYDLQPEMSAYKVTDALMERIESDKYDVIILNFANPDMVGHTGFFEAAVAAIEAVDECVGRLVPAILDKGGQILLTADHGNSEQMQDEKGEPHTAHTTNPVPLIYIGGPEGVKVKSGILADVAPTLIDILGLEKPEAMTGQSLLTVEDG